MGVKEKALTAASSIASGDFLRMVTGGGASRKIDYSKLAKAIVEEYNGSTIAGSAQTLKVALDSLNSKGPMEDPKNASGLDLQTMDFGRYYLAQGQSATNQPDGLTFPVYIEKKLRSSNRAVLFAIDGGGYIYTSLQSGASAWTAWRKI